MRPRRALALAVVLLTLYALLAPAGNAHGAADQHVSATAYCLRGHTANGQHGYYGSVAMGDKRHPGPAFGSRWLVVGVGAVFVVNDRTDGKTDFDVWSSDCRWVDRFGRQPLTIRRVG